MTVAETVQSQLGRRFENPALLEEALSHPSRAQDEPGAPNNQRLEWLGDAVLGLIISETLHRLHPEWREGDLTRNRAILARGPVLADLARDLGLDRAMLLGKTEDHAEGRNRQSSLADTLEAVIGAVFLDGGFPAARDVVLRILGDVDLRLARYTRQDNPKGRLQEYLASLTPPLIPDYHVAETTGPAHNRRFKVTLHYGGKNHTEAWGASIKQAEEDAARQALDGFSSTSS